MVGECSRRHLRRQIAGRLPEGFSAEICAKVSTTENPPAGALDPTRGCLRCGHIWMSATMHHFSEYPDEPHGSGAEGERDGRIRTDEAECLTHRTEKSSPTFRGLLRR